MFSEICPFLGISWLSVLSDMFSHCGGFLGGGNSEVGGGPRYL